MVSAVTIFFISFYLFREGAGFFSHPPLEKGYAVMVHPASSLQSISNEELRKIFIEKSIRNWSQLEGPDQPLGILTLDTADSLYNSKQPEDRIEATSRFLLSHPDFIAVLPEKYGDKKKIRILHPPDLSPADLLLNTAWYPTSEPAPSFGIVAMLIGTLQVTLLSVVLAFPLGTAVGIYLGAVAPSWILSLVRPLIEMIAGIPSVVLGIFGIMVVVPAIQQAFDLPSGVTSLAGGIMLAILALPTLILLTSDAISAVPKSMTLSSLALGASSFQTIFKVVVPAAKSGLFSGAILSLGRIVGETMTVLMVTGNSSQIPHSIF
ncbi:MAG: ABC transporter permease subunit [Leadbetterella sp.]|nr:ABC transporter permease subunit [Leadbetterella sp.]